MPALSLCMIVRDEAEVLARCLDSVADLVDEIVIVDTGSSDDTISIAQRHGAKVLSYTWHDDFSAARNYSFEHATSPYILWLDADDVLPSEDRETLREWKPQFDKDVYYLRYDYLQDEYGASLCLLQRERIVRRNAGLRWHYPIHECLSIPVTATSQELPIRVVHRRTEQGVRRGPVRNLRILEAAVNDPAYSASPRIRYYLGKEYGDAGQCEAAIAEYRAFLNLDGGWAEDRFNAQLRIARCEYQLSRRHDARRSAKLARKMDPRWSEPDYLLGQLALDEEDYEEAVFWYQSCLREIPGVLSPVDTYCYRLGPLVQLCLCYDRLGDHRRAWEFNQQALELRPRDPNLLYNRQYLSGRLSKEPAKQPVRLNLGSGGRRYLDFRSCDKYPGPGVDEIFPLKSIPYPDASVRSIHSEHALEHLPHVEARAALREWFRVLQPGGDLVVKLPDLAACCRAFLDSTTQAERDWYRYTIYGPQNEQNGWPAAREYHQTGFTLAELEEELRSAGFILDISGTYHGFGTPSMYARALKPAQELRVAWVCDREDLVNPQFRVRAHNMDRWLRGHACRSRIVSFEEAMNADVLVFFYGFTARDFARMEQARNAGKRVILDLFEDLFDLPFEWYVPMIRLTHTVVCCSPELARKAAMHNGHVVTIEDAVEADFELNCAYDATERLRIGWIGMRGNVWLAEQLRPAIEAMGHELVTIHDGADTTVRWTLDGWQQTLAGCDAAIVPADFRRQPSKSNNRASNAMALGLPVIVSPLPAYLEFIVHGENGFLAESAEDWLNCIRILANTEVRRRIGQAGKQTARLYDADAIGARWRTLLFQPDPLVDIPIPTCHKPLIVFHTGYAFESWTATNIREGGIGGSETSAALLAEALARRGMRVVVFSPCAGCEGECSGVEYMDTGRFDGFAATHHAHAFIVSRYSELLDAPIRTSRRFLWVHDICALEGETGRVRQRVDSLSAIVCLSPWHKEFFASHYGVPPEKIEVIGNGIDPARFRTPLPRIPGRFIYSSSPDRGLDHLLEIFPAIREQLPGAELQIFYGFDNWEKSSNRSGRAEWRNYVEQLLRQDGVRFHGRVGQDRLAREFLQSDFWFYPTAFTETFCISALEAQMAGALCIATDLAALRTTVGPRGVLLSGDPSSPQYRSAALDTIRRAVEDPEWREQMVSDARAWAAGQSWDDIACLWLRLFEC